MNMFVKLLLLFNFFSFNIFAQDMCDVFWDEIRKETNNLELYNPEYIKFKGFGFDIVDRNYDGPFDIWGDDSYKETEIYLESNSPKLFNTEPNSYFWNAEATVPNKNNDDTRVNLCVDDLNCYEGKTIQELLDIEEFLVIDYFYNYNDVSDFFIDNEFVDVKNISEVKDKLGSFQNYIITQINGKEIDQYSLHELFLIFYTEQYEKTNFKIYGVDRPELSYFKNLDNGLFLIDVDIYPHDIQASPIEIKLNFNDSTNLSTINKEIKFSYDAEFLWHRNDLDKIGDKISKDYMRGEPFYCLLNYNEWLDYGLIAYLPFIDTDYREKIQNTDEIIINYEYWPDQGTYAKVLFPNTTITKNFDFKLNNFPFDRQKVKINFDLQDIYTFQNFIILNTSIMDLYGTIDEEWQMYRGFFHANESSVQLHFEVERNPNYYLFKVYLPILILMVLLYASYFIPAKQIESRLTLTVVTFLALIAYIFVIDDLIPKLSYMTIMDYFVILSFTFAAVPNLWAIYAFNYFNKNSTEHPYFKIIPHITLAVYLLFVLFIFYRGANIYPDNASGFLSTLKLN